MLGHPYYSEQDAERVGEIFFDWRTINREPLCGRDTELAHGRTKPATDVTHEAMRTGKIALAHLNEFPDYHTRLAMLAQEAVRNKGVTGEKLS